MSGFLAVGYFLLALFFSLLSFLLWTRIALRYFKISHLNPVSQVFYTLTNPIIMPLTHLLTPNKTSRLSRYDWPCFCVLVVVELLKFIAIGSLFLGSKLPWTFVPLYTLADLVVQPCNLLFYALLIRVIMSWVNPHGQHPVVQLICVITEPLIRLGRYIIPNISGFDFAPYIMMVILKIITIFINASLPLHFL